MDQLRGRTALVTGASGGLGTHVARRLAGEGMKLVLSGRREDALAAAVEGVRRLGVEAEAIPADLSDLGQLEPLVERSESALGPIDVLVNNAGVENVAAFTSYTRDELTQMVDVNLTAPLLLTRRVVPGMLERGRGHVVFIASLAGKIGPAYSASYAATKAGLVGVTQSLRAEFANAPVGFSVVCPGFIAGDGMYQRVVEQGIRSNRVLGETTTEAVADRVVDAIRRDRPEVIETGAPVRPLLALGQVAPGLAERIVARAGATRLFERVARERGRAGTGDPAPYGRARPSAS